MGDYKSLNWNIQLWSPYLVTTTTDYIRKAIWALARIGPVVVSRNAPLFVTPITQSRWGGGGHITVNKQTRDKYAITFFSNCG